MSIISDDTIDTVCKNVMKSEICGKHKKLIIMIMFDLFFSFPAASIIIIYYYYF